MLDPCPDVSQGKVKFYREAEIKHGRVAMLASVGFLLGELFHPMWGGGLDLPSVIAFQASHLTLTNPTPTPTPNPNPKPDPKPDPKPNPKPEPHPNRYPRCTVSTTSSTAPRRPRLARAPVRASTHAPSCAKVSTGESRQVKVPLGSDPASAPAPLQGAPGGSGQLGTPRNRPTH